MTSVPTHPLLPELPLDEWESSKITLHLYCQIIGKIRMALHPKLNHWWHVTLYVSPRGLTTRGIPTDTDRGGLIDIAFDLIDHNLVIRSSNGQTKVISLYDGLSVAQFYRDVLASLNQLGVEVEINANPFDPERSGSDIPFMQDDLHTHYDPGYVHRFWHILRWVDSVFTEFKGRFYGKSTPVHLFWHSFDLALTRFSGKRTPQAESVDRVTGEAYSHEVISFGFWPGDFNMRAPAFYAYTAPEPSELADSSLVPEQAYWQVSDGSAMALLMYDDLRRMNDPIGALLDFLESAYLAGASKAGWDIDGFKHEYVGYTPPEPRR